MRQRIVALRERREDALLLIGGDADAGVRDGKMQHHGIVVPIADSDANHDFARVRELDGVADQVDDNLAQANRVAHETIGHVGRHHRGQLDALVVGAEGKRVQDVAEVVAQAERGLVEIQLANLDLGEIEDVVQQGKQRIGRFLDEGQILALHGGQGGVERQLGHADDAVHRRADLVTHRGQESALGAVGGLGCLLRRAAPPPRACAP